MRVEEVCTELELRGWFRIDDQIKVDNLQDYRLYAHRDKPGVAITIVGKLDSFLAPSALDSIFSQAGIERSTYQTAQAQRQ